MLRACSRADPEKQVAIKVLRKYRDSTRLSTDYRAEAEALHRGAQVPYTQRIVSSCETNLNYYIVTGNYEVPVCWL